MTIRKQNPPSWISRAGQNRARVVSWGKGKGELSVTVTVDAGRCIACGMCAYAAPEVFRVVGKASTVYAQPEGKNSRVRDAANGCPVNAIRVLEN